MIRGLCESVYVGDKISVCRTLGRYKVYVDTTDIGVAPHLMLDGYWEMWVTEALASLVKPGMIVADAGANVGYFTTLMADLCGPSGRVFAFEPNPAIATLLARSVAVNGLWSWTTIHTDPLADVEGATVELMIPDNDPKNAHIVPVSETESHGGVPLVTRRLDSDPEWRKIELIKIDVEGAEERVWRGMEGLLHGEALKTVVLEFAAARYEDPAAFLRELASHGFNLGYIDIENGLQKTTVESVLQQNSTEDIMLVLQR